LTGVRFPLTAEAGKPAAGSAPERAATDQVTAGPRGA
jgi:hypothetical protein